MYSIINRASCPIKSISRVAKTTMAKERGGGTLFDKESHAKVFHETRQSHPQELIRDIISKLPKVGN